MVRPRGHEHLAAALTGNASRKRTCVLWGFQHLEELSIFLGCTVMRSTISSVSTASSLSKGVVGAPLPWFPAMSNEDSLIVRTRTLTPFGLADRQARFLVTVMLYSGVFIGRQYAAFAGITHGQKVHDFLEKLLVRRFVTPIELGSTGRMKIFHVHHKPLYAAIGEPDNRNRRRVTIDRAIERLMVLDGVSDSASLP